MMLRLVVRPTNESIREGLKHLSISEGHKDRQPCEMSKCSLADIATETTLHVRFGSKADMCAAKGHVRFTPESDIKCDTAKGQSGHATFGTLAFSYASFAKSTNIESDLLWVLHVEKALLSKFAGEVWIDLPERGDGGPSFIRSLQMPQGSNPV